MKLRVLHVLSQRPLLTGSGVTLDALVRHARAAGHEQLVAAGIPAAEPPPAVGGLPADRLAPLLFGTSALPFPVPGMSDVMPYPSTRFSEMTPEMLDAYRGAWRTHLRRIASDFAPDVIHAHHVWLVGALIKDAAPGVPVVSHCHATGLRQLRLCPHLAGEVRKGCRRNERFAVLGEEHRSALAGALDVPPERIEVVGAGYREDLFRDDGGERGGGARLLYVGKYSRAKGLPWLLDAFGRLRAARPGLELHVAGGGAGPEAEGIRARLGATPGIVLHGQLDQPRLAELMRRSAVCVLPSFYEGVPLVLAEARACGCRVVCTDLPGVRERLAPALGEALSLVPLPRLARVDEPEPGDLPAFVDALEGTVAGALDAGPPPPCGDALAPLSWRAVFRRVERLWLSLAAALFLALLPTACAPAPQPVAPAAGKTAPEPPAAAEKAATPDAAIAALLERMRQTAPAGFRVAAAPPFVVAGDGPAEAFARRVTIVEWAVEMLERSFFDRRPEAPIAIWLFDGPESYREHARALFGETPDTPYGFYSPTHRALLMDISTGGGTLVHEIVHPFAEVDFPGCPPWVNEGLGSLFEQSAERDGRIVGLTNWRLPGFQEAIREGEVPPLRDLFAADADAFYGADPGTNYAQSRYLLYYLQERGLLERFYREARAAAATDPTGEATLLGVLGETDLAAFQRRFEAWVLGLRFSP